MRTTGFFIANYCVPCHAHCRYCLLASCGKTSGVDYYRSTEFAHRVFEELSVKRPALSTYFYIAYCMDAPYLRDYIRFSAQHHSPGANFLQMNGCAFRDEAEMHGFMRMIHEEGVQLIDLSFYGLEEYHNRFAGRKGDFKHLIQMLSAACDSALPVNVSIPLLRGNLNQQSELRKLLQQYPVSKFTYFLPHSKGRGKEIQGERITRAEFDGLPDEIKSSFVRVTHRTQAEWIASNHWEQPEKRHLALVLTKENIDSFESMGGEEILTFLEKLDDTYRLQMPEAKELAAKYGEAKNEQLYRYQDLLLKWEQQYIAESGNTIYDMHDETHHFSVYQ